MNNIKHWDPETVEKRQEKLMKVFIDKWGLKSNENFIDILAGSKY